MTELKRKSISDDLSEIEIKKFRNEFNPTINCFENLSNDLLCEIFDYFDGYTLHEIFSNLNYRFEELLHSSCVLFKTYCVLFNCKEILNIFKQQVFNNRSQIFSLHINFILENTDFFTSFIFDSSFHRLESIVFENIKFNTIIPIVNNLFSLPCLFSLTIETSNITKEINDIYQLIFTLPKLKYYRINSLNEYHHHHHPLILLSMPINNQFSSIQYLIINHYCSLNELTYFISYTPQLRRLTVHKMKTNNDTTIPLLPLITLVHLKSLYLDLHKIKFNEMEIFFQNIFLNLNILTIIGRDDTSFLDAYRWKQLILQSFPYLKQFYLFYDDYVDNEEKYPIYTGGLNQFSSSFWIEQKSMIDVEVKTGNIQYIIHPYKRKRWYHDIEDHILNYSIFNRLIFEYIPDDIYEHSVIEDIQRVLSITQIYHLEIHDEKLSISTLIHIINVLPDIITLKIHSLSIDETDELTAKDVIILCSMKERQNKIIKIYLEEINDDQELNFLFTLCPYVEYLKIESIKTMNIDLFLRKFFKRINLDKNSYLHSLCFNLSSENDQIIEDIKQMITCEKLLNQFNIKRILNTVYLQWNTDVGNVSGLGFKVVLTSFRYPNKTHPCDPNDDEFLCNNNECISSLLLCDGIAHCLDTSDEFSSYCNSNIGESTNNNMNSNNRKIFNKHQYWRGISIIIFLLLIFIAFIIFIIYFIYRRFVHPPMSLLNQHENKNYLTIVNSPLNGPKTEVILSNRKRLDDDYNLI